MTEPINYPDLEPSTLGDLKEIRLRPDLKRRAPKIAWGDVYKGWPIEKRLHYAEALSASMNQAALILQGERKELSDICKHQEAQIREHMKRYTALTDVVSKEIARANTERQELYQEIVDLKAEIRGHHD